MRKGRSDKISWAQPLAKFVQPAIDPVVRRQGFGQSSLVLFWDDIAGERLAAVSQPIKMQWPPRGHDRTLDNGASAATLIVRVESGFALEFQHLAPILIERVNAHFGWRCISRILLKQGPIAARRPLPQHAVCPPAKAAELAAEKLVGDVREEPLRQALTRLGARVLAGA